MPGSCYCDANALVFPQRSDIVKAVYEPTDEECEWKAAEEEELTVSNQAQPVRTGIQLLPSAATSRN